MRPSHLVHLGLLAGFALAFPAASSDDPAPRSADSDSTVIVGVTEPGRSLELAFPEAGVIRRLEVEEGDSVAAGTVLAQLDCRVLDAQLAAARMKASSTAAIQGAAATLRMREERLAQIERLANSDRANADELARARAEAEIARADYQLAREAAEEQAHLAAQTEALIEQRTLRAPFDGVVARIHHEAHASFAPQDGPVLTLVRLEELDLVAHLDHRHLDGLAEGDEVRVEALDRERSGNATLAFLSPVVDPSSGTARLRFRLDNAEGRHRSGVKYRIILPGTPLAGASPEAEKHAAAAP